MKLASICESLILELFDDLDDISKINKETRGNLYKYMWHEDNYRYLVLISKNDILDIKQDVWPDGIPVWEISLQAHSDKSLDRFSPTGKGNFGTVYKNLLSVIKDFMVSERPYSISFSPSVPGMRLVYDKFMKKFLSNKNNPNEMFYEYEIKNGDVNIYISQEAIDSISDRSEKESVLNSIRSATNDHNSNLEHDSRILKDNRKYNLSGS